MKGETYDQAQWTSQRRCGHQDFCGSHCNPNRGRWRREPTPMLELYLHSRSMSATRSVSLVCYRGSYSERRNQSNLTGGGSDGHTLFAVFVLSLSNIFCVSSFGAILILADIPLLRPFTRCCAVICLPRIC